MRGDWRNLATPVFAVGVVLFLVAVVGGGNAVFAVADILIGAGIAMYAAKGAPPGARRPQLFVGGLAVASAAAILDGVLTLAGESTVAGALTWVVVAGTVIAFIGAGTRH